MNPLYIAQTRKNPLFEFNTNGYLLLKGRAINETPEKEFFPAVEWCKKIKSQQVIFSIGLEYLNSASTRLLLSLFNALNENRKICTVSVCWFIDTFDTKMRDVGEIFIDMYPRFNFELHTTL